MRKTFIHALKHRAVNGKFQLIILIPKDKHFIGYLK